MTYLFPLLTVWWGGLFPSGLILYWVVYTAYLTAQQFRIMGWGNLFPLFGWQPGFVPPPDDLGLKKRRDALPSNQEQGKRTVQPSNPRPPSTPGGNRPAARSNKQKRRGRRR
jgi:hypothetical protein